jgi:hypothetical protein
VSPAEGEGRRPLSTADGQRLAAEWIAAWNTHDLDTIMGLYASTIVFQTPTIIDTLGIPDGRIQGPDRLRQHFRLGLERLPNLHFELERVYVGVRHVALTYRWADGTEVCELHEYDGDELIHDVQALYESLSW